MAIDNPYGEYYPGWYYDDPTQGPYQPPPDAPEPPPTTPGGPAPAPTQTADPWATAPTDGNWQRWFMANVQGLTPNSDSLAGLEPKLTPHNIAVLRNAQGIAGKIKLPNGQIVDVGRAFSSGDPSQMAWAWQTGDEGGDIPTNPVNPEYLTPFTDPMPGTYEPGTYDPTEFTAPDGQTILSDPSYQFRRDEGMRGLLNNRAARGLLNTGGSLKAITNYNQGAASQEYANAWDRAFSEWGTEENNRRSAFDTNESGRKAASEDAWKAWFAARDTWYANQNNPFNKLHGAGTSYGG